MPPQAHINVQVLLIVGFIPMVTVGEPGVQGADVTGMQGWGVKTPCAAEVAAATCGFDRVVHMPKGITFFMGTLSMIVAAGILQPFIRFSGVMSSWLGVVPKLHRIVALLVTSVAMLRSLLLPSPQSHPKGSGLGSGDWFNSNSLWRL
jgi:hypothetical protein